MTKLPSPGPGTPSGGHAPAHELRAHWELTRATLSEVRSAPNQETRGRFPNAGLDRVEAYLAQDPLFQKLLKRLASLEANGANLAEQFRSQVKHSLAVIERLANRNPEIRAIERLGEHLPKAYQLITTNVYGTLIRRSGVSVSPWTPRHDKAQTRTRSAGNAFAPQPSDETPAQDLVATNSSHTVQAQGPEEVFDEQLYEAACNFLDGSMDSVTKRVDLYRGIQQILSRLPFSTAAELIAEAFPHDGSLFQQLRQLSEIVEQCAELMQGKPTSCSDLALLHDQIADLSHSHSFHSEPPPMQRFLDEGIVSPELARQLHEAAEQLRNPRPVVLKLHAMLCRKHVVSTSHVKALGEVVARLSFAGLDDEEISAKLSTVLRSGPQKIDHLLNVAKLASFGLNVRNFFSLSRECEAVIHGAVAGTGAQTATGSQHLRDTMQQAVELNLRIASEPRAEVRELVRRAEHEFPSLSDSDRTVVKGAVLELGRHIPGPSLLLPRGSIGADLATLHQAGINLHHLTAMVRAAGQENPALVNQYLEYAANLATLGRNGVRGTEKLFANSYEVWSRARSGDRNQDMSGFLVEATVALRLQTLGYTLLAVSTANQKSGFEYDVLAVDPNGTTVGIEVKRQLATIIDKNGWGADKIHQTQLGRHCRAAQADKIEPRIVVLDFSQRERWGPQVAELMRKASEQTGVAVRVVSSKDGTSL